MQSYEKKGNYSHFYNKYIKKHIIFNKERETPIKGSLSSYYRKD